MLMQELCHSRQACKVNLEKILGKTLHLHVRLLKEVENKHNVDTICLHGDGGVMARRYLVEFLVLLVSLAAFSSALALPEDAQSTSGPMPPKVVSVGIASTAVTGQKIISGVPVYIWKNGCGPTAAGMVIGYWDKLGFGNLVAGDASTHTASVDNMISSSGNYTDYCLPMDSYPDMLPDKSELPAGDEHVNNCLTDFMYTSQSYQGNYYGWSWFSHMSLALSNYAALKEPVCQITAANYIWGTLTWSNYCSEIDSGRPVVLLVDSDSNGGTDHFITAIGYGYSGTRPMYACLNTWDSGIHWYEFAPMASGQAWGIYGATFFSMIGPTVSTAKTSGNNATAKIHGGLVTAAFTDYFYVESPDQQCGLRVNKTAHGLATGMRVDLSGTMKASTDGERYLDCSYAAQDGTGTVKPLGIRNDALGGTSWRYNSSTGAGQQGITNAHGLNNLGLLVRAWGRVTYKGSGYVYIDDGSKLRDNSGHIGIKITASGTLPNVNDFVQVTGISSCFKSGGTVYRVVRAKEIVLLY